ncbi:MAG: AAA family ATPase, partial [bacterium]|nr:AAA family ATPase [bacterium]
MSGDLFAAAATERLAESAPLADRLRPRGLDEVVGQQHLLGRGRPLRSLIESDRLSSTILWGPPGTGKTTIARLVACSTARAYIQLSAVTATVKDVREVIASARDRLGQRDQGTILFLDEVHRFNRAQQDALLPAVESGLVSNDAATTENPYFEVNPPLRSRSTLFRLEPLDPEAIGELLSRGLDSEGAEADRDALAHLATQAAGDGRQALTSLEVALALASARSQDRPRVSLTDAESALGASAVRYGRDEHYDVISAFIK